MNQSLIFSLKVWSTSVFIGPLLLLFNASNQTAVMFNADITAVIDYVFSVDFLTYYAVAIIMGSICSVPCFLFLWFCFSMLTRTSLSAIKIRILLVPLSLFCCAVIFMLFSLSDLGNFWSKGNMIMVGAYAIPLIFGVFFYRVYLRKHVISDSEETEITE